MDEKQLVSQALSAAIDGVLGVEQIAAIIEKPKSSDLGDLAFPAFQLAKTLRKSPQIIAGEIAEKIDTKGFEKVIAVGPYVNFFLDKNATASEVMNITVMQILVKEEMFRLICLRQILLNLFQLDIYVQLLSGIQSPKFTKNWVIGQSKSITWATGVNNLVF